MFPGSVLDRPHAFLYGGVLDTDAANAGTRLLRLLRGAVNQVVVALVRRRDEGAPDQRHVDAFAGMRGFALGFGQSAIRVIVDAECPEMTAVDGKERMAAARVVPVRRKE